MSQPELSVVIATVGRGTLAAAAASAQESLRRCGAAGELLIVWQGAAEPPPELSGPARVLDVFPVGLGYARNRGLASSRGRVVAYLDDDELVAPEWAGALLEAFAAEPAPGAVFGAVVPMDTAGRPYCLVDGGRPVRFTRPGTPPWVVGTGGNMAFDRALLTAAGGFDPRFGAGAPERSAEEAELIVRLLRRGVPIAYTPTAVAYHPSKTPAEHLASRRPYGHGAGAVARHLLAPGLAARYLVALGQSFGTGVRSHDRARRREAVATLAGFLAGASPRPAQRSPLRHLDRLPAGLPAASGSPRPLPASYRPRPVFAYRLSASLLLRIVVGPEPVDPPVGRVLGQVASRDAVWSVEARR